MKWGEVSLGKRFIYVFVCVLCLLYLHFYLECTGGN
jgi:hypothetical protein